MPPDGGYGIDNLQEVDRAVRNAIFFDREHGTMWCGWSHHGEDYGIEW